MTWAGKRQLLIIGGATLVVLAVLYPVLKPVIAPTPTCFDNKQNQDELGIDCSGSCQKICASETSPIKVLWVRPFKVADGVYNAVAYVTNPNAEYAIKNAPYTLKLFDEKNILVTERSGNIDVPAKSAMPIFEGGIVVSKANVKEVFFELGENLNWQRGSQVKKKISVGAPILENGTTPRVLATIKNTTLDNLKNISFVAIVFDKKGNAQGASKTVVDFLGKNETTEVIFTWQTSFTNEIGPIEIHPMTAD